MAKGLALARSENSLVQPDPRQEGLVTPTYAFGEAET